MSTKEQLMAFYEKCEAEGVISICDPFMERKAMQIASSMGLNVSDIQSYFDKAKAETLAIRQMRNEKKREEEKRAAIEKAKREDPIFLDKYSAYSDYYGSDKIIKMVTDEFLNNSSVLKQQLKRHNDEIDHLNELVSFVYKDGMNSMRKERDWAVAGGIAQGVAGPAAGLASAINAQNENIEIRKNNAAISAKTASNMQALAYGLSKEKQQLREVEEKLKSLTEQHKKEIEKCKLKVLGDEDDDTVFREVVITNISYSYTIIGSVLVEVDVYQKNPCVIFGKQSAFVDGSLLAKIFQDDILIGVADLVLPKTGLLNSNSASKFCRIKGISMCNADQSKKCSIEIVPKNLWKMEA